MSVLLLGAGKGGAGAALAPIAITSSATFSAAENQTTVGTLTATGGLGSFTWTKIGGADTAKFTLTSGGVLTFTSAPDFETPTDADANNVYLVQVQASDGVSTPATQSISVTVTDVSETTLDLDFIAMAGTLDPRITFARTSVGTYFNSAGVLTTAASGAPRFDYDPVTLQLRGLLLEHTRGNRVLRSQDFGNAAWALLNATRTTGISSPDGSANAATVTGNGAGATGNALTQSFGAASPITTTWSIFGKKGSVDFLVLEGNIDGTAATKKRAWFNLATGAVGATDAGVTASIKNAGNGGWWRCAIRIANTATSGLWFAAGPAAVNGVWSAETGSVNVFGAQAEQYDTAHPSLTSYIPTVSSVVTRSSETGTLTGANFSSWYNAPEGTFLAEFRVWELCSSTVFSQFPVSTQPSSDAVGIGVMQNYAKFTALSGAGTVFDQNSAAGSLVANAEAKAALAYKVNDFAGCLNSGAVVTDTLGAVPVGSNALRLGTRWDNTQVFTGHVRRLRYYPFRRSNSDLVTITS